MNRTVIKDRIKETVDRIPSSKLEETLRFVEFLEGEVQTTPSDGNDRRIILDSAGLWEGEIAGTDYENQLRNGWATRLKEN